MTLKKLCPAILAFSLLAIPAVAQKSHSNKGGAARADNRADAVQTTKKDKDRDPSRDNDKNKGKHKGETQGKHNGATQGKHTAKGHSH
jgi:Ni/Co efflux regulator RcnB